MAQLHSPRSARSFRSATAALLAASLIVLQIFLTSPAALAQSSARTGCLNQWLFNGVWRVKVTKVEPVMNGSQQSGWQVTETWRNGTSRELAPADSYLKPQQLSLGGQTLDAEDHRQAGVAFNTFAPSGEFTYIQTFFGPNMSVDPANKPKALDVAFDGAKVAAATSKPHFSSPQYNFHFDLTCAAAGASAQAQGGSTQVAGAEGCMNQWMSNGVWKMRVLAVGPNPPDATPNNQNGWRVKQEWVNISSGKVYPGVLPDVSNRVAPANVGDEFLATKNGNNASTANMAGGFALGGRNVPFAPGEPYTFEQNFGWSPFDAGDTPTRLIVTFNTTAQSKVHLAIPVPHYRNPANFRINLTCGGSVASVGGVQATQQQSQQSVASNTSAAGNPKADPCALLTSSDVASALGVAARSVKTAQRPQPDECAWNVASRAGAPAQSVVLVVQNVQQSKAGCKGLQCLHAVQSMLGAASIPSLPAQFGDAFADAQIIAGLGDKAAWKDGRLTVVKADLAFQLLVHGSSRLSTSEALARDVLTRIP